MFSFSISTLIIIITVWVSYQGFTNPIFFQKYMFHIGSIKRGEQLRLITSGFLHGDWMHLAFNMISFYSFSQVLEINLDTIQLLGVYFGSMIIGNVFSYYIHQKEFNYSAIGASGAVSGAIYCAVLLEPNIRLLVLFIPMPGYVFAIVYLLYSIFGMKGKFDNIGHTAHFGGAIGGLLLTLVYFPELILERTLFIGIMLIPIVILFLMLKFKKI